MACEARMPSRVTTSQDHGFVIETLKNEPVSPKPHQVADGICIGCGCSVKVIQIVPICPGQAIEQPV